MRKIRNGLVRFICFLGNLFVSPLWRRRAREDLSQSRIRKILVVRSRFLGDVLQTTPLTMELRKNFPQAYIAYIVSDGLKEVLEGNPCLDEVIGGDAWFDNTEGWQGRLRFIRGLRKKQFDLVITLGTFAHYYLLSFFSGARHRIGLDLNKRGFLLTRRVDFDWESPKNRADWFLETLKLMGIEPSGDKTLTIDIPLKASSYATDLLMESGVTKEDKLVALLPGDPRRSSQEEYPRRWPKERFARLGDELVRKYGVKVVLLGSPRERELCHQVKDLMEKRPVNLAGKTTLKQLAAVLKQVTLLVGNDSGPIFIAAAVGTPTVAIFGPQDPRRSMPYGKHHHGVYKDIECSPCYNPGKKCLCKEADCFKKVEVKDVLQVADIELGSGGRQ